MEYNFDRQEQDEDNTCIPCLAMFHTHRTSPPPLRHAVTGRGSLHMEGGGVEEATPLVSSAWQFSWPSTSMLIPNGDPADHGMQVGAIYQGIAEREYANDTFASNRELQVKLRLRTFALDVAKSSIETLKTRVATLEEELETCKKKLDEFYKKEEAQDRLSQDIWGPMRRDTSAWDVMPVLLDSPASREFLDRPLILTHVALEMGFTCRPSELRKLTTLVYDAYIGLHGYPPSPKIWYGMDGTPQRVCCFTQRDKDLVMSVISKEGPTLFQEVPLVFQAVSGPEALM